MTGQYERELAKPGHVAGEYQPSLIDKARYLWARLRRWVVYE